MNLFKKLFGGKSRVARVDVTRRFELLGHTGQGTMSKVWRAKDTASGKIVALKILDKDKTAKFEARFAGLNKPSEGEIAVQLQHPNIVRTFEHGLTHKDEPFLLMEFIEGVGLSFLVETQNDVMREYRLRLMVELGDAIEHFHRNNWIHRDICPRNVMVDRDQHVKLIDFGLVVPNTPEFRKPGNRTGKSNYMAPELIKRQPTDQRIDVFSYAVTCFEMCTRQLPWGAGESIDAMMRQINDPPKSLQKLAPELDANVADVIMRGLAISPRDRWQSVGQMVAKFRDTQ